MHSHHNSTHRLRLLIGTLALLLAVLGWGLSYKTSLYRNQETIFHSALVPSAKFILENEKSLGSLVAVISSAPSRLPGLASPHFFAAGYDGKSLCGEGCLLCDWPNELSQHEPRWQFFIRPPPLS